MPARRSSVPLVASASPPPAADASSSSFRPPLHSPNRLLASLNVTMPASRNGFPAFAAGIAQLHPNAKSEHVFTPGLLFSSVGKGPSRAGGNEWWSSLNTAGETARAASSESGARTSEINPFEVALASTSSNPPLPAAGTVAPHLSHLGAPSASGHVRRATVSFTGSGLTPFLAGSDSNAPASELWASLDHAGGLEQFYGGIDSWIDFSGGHPGTPGAGGSAHNVRSMAAKRASDALLVDHSQPVAKRARVSLASLETSMTDKERLDPKGRAGFLERTKTLDTVVSERSPESILDHIGASPLTSGLTTGSADTTLTPPLTLETLPSGMTIAGNTGSGSGLTIQQRRQDKPYVKSQVSRIAPDLTQAVPTFVGIDRYSNTIGAAPEGARDVVAEFLRTMHGGAAHVGTNSAAAQSGSVNPRVVAAAPSSSTNALSSLMEWPAQRDPFKNPVEPREYATASMSTLLNSSASTANRTGERTVQDGARPAPISTQTKTAKDLDNMLAMPSPTQSDLSGQGKLMGGSEEGKRKQFLERNRVAACKSRAKKKEWQEALEQRASELSSHNSELQNLVSVMRDEIVSLRGLVASHAACSCGSLKGFVESGGLGVPQGFGAWGLGRPAAIGAATEYVRNQQKVQDESTTSTSKSNAVGSNEEGAGGGGVLSAGARAAAFLASGRSGSVDGSIPSFLLAGMSRQQGGVTTSSSSNFEGILNKLPVRPNSAPPTTPTPGLLKKDMSSYFVDKNE